MPNSIVELFNRCHQLDRVEQQKVIEKLRLDDPKMADELDALLKAEPTQFGIPAKPDDHQSSSFQIPQVIDEYRVEGILGVGGMGMVLQGHRADIDLSVAIKVAHQSNTSKTTKIALEQEAKILASLEHPNIASIKDWGTIDNFGHFIATEFIRGKTIRQYCEDENLSIKAIIQLFLKVISAVSHAHSRLVLHRDIKPSNIMVTDQGEPKLIDFGVAKVMTSIHESEEQTLSAGLTPSYASPEQLAGKPLSIRSDIFSLGVVMLDLVLPVNSDHKLKSINNIEQRLQLSRQENKKIWQGLNNQAVADLALVLITATAEDLNVRYKNGEDFANDLNAILSQRPIKARAPSSWYKFRKFVSRNRIAASIFGITLLMTLAASGLAAWQWQEAILQKELTLQTNKELESYSNFLNTNFKLMNAFNGGDPDLKMREFMSKAVNLLKNEETVPPERLAKHAFMISQTYNSWGKYNESLDVIDEALKIIENTHHQKIRIELLAEKVVLLHNLANFQSCVTTAILALELASAIPHDGRDKFQLSILSNLQFCYVGLGEVSKSIKVSESILKLKPEPEIAAKAHFALANSRVSLMQLEKGYLNLEETLSFYKKEYGEDSGLYLNALALQFRYKSLLNPESLNDTLVEEIKQKFVSVYTQEHLNNTIVKATFAEAYYLGNQIDKAVKLQNQMLDEFTQIGLPPTVIAMTKMLAIKYLILNNELDKASKLLLSIDITDSQLTKAAELSQFYLLNSDLAIKMGQFEQANKFLMKAKNFIDETDSPTDDVDYYFLIALVSATQDNWQKCYQSANNTASKAIGLYPKTWQLPNVYRYLADVCQLKHDNRQVNNSDFPYLQAVMDSPWKQEAMLVSQILNTE
ncbi:hypothetical protein GCM10011365_24110 [Marinicella pacifica]|uniref:Protein kinase domain-containing protein n=1 Tax=Marinicella pacifica TaxID=1171543 RepID=A0A917CYH7_9GAMM|nr:serine/threonine-protein kinase [Marinicella pacifica]GGG02111.1 hypothetical protein GCM10011365_24110 [Marinicella pacifica]